MRNFQFGNGKIALRQFYLLLAALDVVAGLLVIYLNYLQVYVYNVESSSLTGYSAPSFLFFFVPFILVTVLASVMGLLVYLDYKRSVLWGLMSILVIIADYILFRFFFFIIIVFLTAGLIPAILNEKASNPRNNTQL